MKIQYYLRGLGIGIIVTALVMGITKDRKEPLTEAEIRAMALEIGMVDSNSLKLTDTQASGEPDSFSGTPEPGEPSGDEGPGEGEDGEEPGEPSGDEGQPDEGITVEIEPGAGSRAICRMLEEAGLIEDADSFDRYLIDNGYSKRIRMGTYVIIPGTDPEEIARIITRDR